MYLRICSEAPDRPNAKFALSLAKTRKSFVP